MTDAILLRHLADDSELKDFDLIIIDEFHERNLNQDVVLGVVKELQELGRNIKLLVMSATLDVTSLANFLPGAHVIDVPGQVFPLEVRHVQTPTRPATDFDFIQRVSDLTQTLVRESRGDILVFLPGVGEIARVQQKLEDARIERDIIPLHGSLPLEEQKRVLLRSERPRVVLSTNIAEASVTVPGTDTVLDTGLARIVTVNLRSGFEKLDLVRIARFNAKQRAGRAARERAGLCVRMWTQFEDASLDEQATPECQRVDLSETLLLLSHLGVRDFPTFSWLQTPPKILFDFAMRSLRLIEALDENGKLTAVGQRLMRLPVAPRWGALLIFAENENAGGLGARLAALLNDRDIVMKKHEGAAYTECDVTYRIELLEEVERKGRALGVHVRQAEMVLATAGQLFKVSRSNANAIDAVEIKRLLLLTQTDRLCRRRKDTDRAVMVGGRGVRLSPESQVKASEFFVSLQGIDLTGQPDTSISIACGFEKNFVLEVLKEKIEVVEDVYFDEAKGQFFSRRIRRYQDLDLDEPTLSPLSAEAIGDAFVEALVQRWGWLIEQNPGLKAWLARWNFLAGTHETFRDLLTPEKIEQAVRLASFGKTKVSEVLNENFGTWLESLLDSKVVQDFHRHAPSHFVAATGNRYPILYSENEPPSVEVRLQEMFGITENPKLAFGKTPLTFKLLAPNYRPTQVTADIASFWRNMYFEVRKELRSRYPKHSWPEDPLTAPPVAKGPRKRT